MVEWNMLNQHSGPKMSLSSVLLCSLCISLLQSISFVLSLSCLLLVSFFLSFYSPQCSPDVCPRSLCFFSKFESGNLRKAIQVRRWDSCITIQLTYTSAHTNMCCRQLAECPWASFVVHSQSHSLSFLCFHSFSKLVSSTHARSNQRRCLQSSSHVFK